MTARDRILAAAFRSIRENGFGGASTLEIANEAHVSKRDLYALFENKDEILLACISERAAAIGNSVVLPAPDSPAQLAQILQTFGVRLLKGTTRPEVVTALRFAIARHHDLPSAARSIDKNGRRASRAALVSVLTVAIEKGMLKRIEAEKMVRTYFGLLWGDLQLGILLGVTKTPSEDELHAISVDATNAFLLIFGAEK